MGHGQLQNQEIQQICLKVAFITTTSGFYESGKLQNLYDHPKNIGQLILILSIFAERRRL